MQQKAMLESPALARRVQARAIALGQLTAVRIGGTSVGDGPHRVDNVARGQVVAVGHLGLGRWLRVPLRCHEVSHKPARNCTPAKVWMALSMQ